MCHYCTCCAIDACPIRVAKKLENDPQLSVTAPKLLLHLLTMAPAQSESRSLWTRIYDEIGLRTYIDTPYDVKILSVQRFVRLAAYGASTLVLVLYLVAQGNSIEKVGSFMTLTLLGDVLISLVLTVIADKIGRKRMLALGSLLMTISGVIFACTSSFWALLAASILGVISPSGNEVGPFKAIEESTISQLSPSSDRSSVLAWYTLHGTAGAAMGTVICGWVIRVLQTDRGWEPLGAYRAVFAAYAVMGLVKFMLCLMLSSAVEIDAAPKEQDGERRPLLADASEEQAPSPSRASKSNTFLPQLSRETLTLVCKLGFLFAMDSLASGLIPAAWLVFFFNRKFGLREEKLGSLFFVTNIVSSASNLVSSSLARRIGLVKTMVFTHAPSSIALALIPIPSNLAFAMVLLIIRASISSMDQAPRQAFLAAAVLPTERTTVMGIVNVVKTLSQSIGPVITGRLAASGKFWVVFVIAGCLKLAYDGLLLGMFLSYKTVEEKAQAIVTEEIEREREEGIDDSRDVA